MANKIKNINTFNTIPVTLKYFSRSFLSNPVMHTPRPDRLLIIVARIRIFEAFGSPILVFILEGIEFNVIKKRIILKMEIKKDNLEKMPGISIL